MLCPNAVRILKVKNYVKTKINSILYLLVYNGAQWNKNTYRRCLKSNERSRKKEPQKNGE